MSSGRAEIPADTVTITETDSSTGAAPPATGPGDTAKTKKARRHARRRTARVLLDTSVIVTAVAVSLWDWSAWT